MTITTDLKSFELMRAITYDGHEMRAKPGLIVTLELYYGGVRQ